MKKWKSYTGFIFLTIAHFLICIFAGIMGWDWQTVIVPVVSIFSIVLANKSFGRKPAVALLTVAPFFLIYITTFFLIDAYPATCPIWIFGLLVSALTFLFLQYKVIPAISIPILSLVVLFDGLIAWPNTFSYVSIKDFKKYSLDETKLVDINEKDLSVRNFKGKVVLLDVWHSSCGYCFKKFPELQKLYDDFKKDTNVRIISLNMPLKKDKGIRPSKYIEQYSFEKLYFKTEEEYERLSIQAAPLVLILDKNQQCRYAGGLNTGWNIFIGNAKRIINKLKNENAQTPDMATAH